MVLEILTYPNKKLFEKSKDITKFDENLHKFLDDMYETMLEKKGIGLAAIQVGKPIRALIINIPNDEGQIFKENLLEIINPKIINKSGEIIFQEGCLSVPEFYEDVKRFQNLTLEYQDRHGKFCSLDAVDLLAVCIQHEMDHLDGKLFIEKIPYKKRKEFGKNFKNKR